MKYAILYVNSLPVSDFNATVTYRVAVKNRRKNTNFHTFPFATQRIPLISQIGEWDGIPRKKNAYFLHRSNYGAAGSDTVEIRTHKELQEDYR